MILPNLVSRSRISCYRIWCYMIEFGVISLAIVLTHDVLTKFRLQAVVFFLVACGFGDCRLAIGNCKLPSSIPKKNNNCSQSRENYVYKVIFYFRLGLCCFSYIFCVRAV